MADNNWALAGNAGTNPPNDFLGTTDNKSLVIKTNGTEVMHLDTSGNVGIGTTTPNARLMVRAPDQLGLVVLGPNERVGAGLQLQAERGRGWEILATGATSAQGEGKLNIRDLGNATDDLTITSGGNVGIGTTSPDGKLHVTSGADFRSPQVVIAQTTPFDFARLRFLSSGVDPDSTKPVAFPLWDIAAGRGLMTFFRQDTGNVLTLTSAREPGAAIHVPRVGINTETPETTLHVNGIATVDVLRITGGGDLAEPFSVEEGAGVEPGTVMVINERHPGKLKISDTAHDSKVAGVVSGAGGIKPGLTLQPGSTSEGETHVALAGRVFCKAEAISSPIEPGDLLTTSNIPGHAMRAVDRQASHGAILGKAMSPLPDGRGLVLILVNLQ